MPDNSHQAHISAYLAQLATQRRASPHTVSNYRRDLDKLSTLSMDLPLTDLATHHIRRYVAQLHAGGLSARSLGRLLSAWRGFFAWLLQHGAMTLNPCTGLHPPKAAKPLPKALSVDEAMRLLDAPLDDNQDPALQARDRAMFELCYSAGLRLAELAALDCDVAAEAAREGEIRVVGKRQKARILPVGDIAVTALSAWLPYRHSLAAADETALFVNRRGQRLGMRSIQLRLAQFARQAGLVRHVHPHMLRHAFASHMLQSSGDLRAVQDLLGHASIASTQIYTHLDFQHLAQVYDQAHPRAKRD